MELFTEKEKKVIECFGKAMNYPTLEENLDDNCTWIDVKELSEDTGFTVETVKGIIGSLTKKDLVYVEIVNFNEKVLMVTDEGVKAYFNLFS
jgi:DNA-binding MarR family transcriptional regulator